MRVWSLLVTSLIVAVAAAAAPVPPPRAPAAAAKAKAPAARHDHRALRRVIESVAKAYNTGQSPVVIFDIDDTLTNTAGRHLQILKEFAADPDIRAAYPKEAGAIEKGLDPAKIRYRIIDSVRALGVSNKELEAKLEPFWSQRFFANNYVVYDPPVFGAKDYVEKILANGGLIVYLAARSEEMRAGSVLALKTLGFPEPDGKTVRLLMKADKKLKDHEYKDAECRRISALGKVVAGFDNEPRNVNVLLKNFPGATIVFLDTKHSGALDGSGKPAVPAPGVVWVRDYSLP